MSNEPVDVWIVDLASPAECSPADCSPAGCSPDEIARARSFRRPEAGARWLAGRQALRDILGAATGTAPEAISFAEQEHGRPVLPDHPDVWFSLSHARTLTAVAVAASPVGVDIEQPRRLIAPDRLARRLFGPDAATPSPEQLLRHWTRLEAVLKAVGTGIAGGTAGAIERLTADGWRIHDLEIAGAYGAVASRGEGWEPHLHPYVATCR